MGFLAAFLSRDQGQSHWRLLGPPGTSVPGPVRGRGRGSGCHCCPAADFSAQRHSAGTWASFFFWPCLFWFLMPQGQNHSPGSGKRWTRRCRLAVAPGRGRCPWGQDLLLPRSLPSELNLSCPMRDTICFLVCPPASQGNINKFADSGISWPYFSPVPSSALVQRSQDTLVSEGWLPLKAWSLLPAFTGSDLHNSYIRPLWLPSERRLLINSTWFVFWNAFKGREESSGGSTKP